VDPSPWAWLFVVVVAVWWPVLLVAGLLIVGPLAGAVIVAIVGAVTRSIRGGRADDGVEDEQPSEAFPELFESLAVESAVPVTHVSQHRDDSI
jgi:uncharacterized membrane protein